MFRRLLLVFTDPELRLKLLKIIGLLVVARLLAHIPIPLLGIEDISETINNDSIFQLINTISGGAYGRLSFVMLGIGPYITASIVMQLMGVIVPKIREIQKEEGEQGRQKINRWTRFLTVPLAALNAWGILRFLSSDQTTAGIFDVLQGDQAAWSWVVVIISMTAGSLIMMWIGEIITEFKMGNGISLLILAGIVARLPQQASSFIQSVFPNFQELFNKFTFDKLINFDVWKALLWENPSWDPVRGTLIFVFVSLITLMLVIFINDAVRRLVVVYSRRGHSEGASRTLSNVKADLPIKVNIAGVIPIIFAVSFILFPTIISRFFITSNLENLTEISQNVTSYLSTNPSADPLASVKPTNLPNGAFGFYGTTNISDLEAAQGYDTTEGQEMFGFTLSTQDGVQNLLFKGTFLEFDFNSTDLGFLPEYSIYFSGVLAYNFFYFFLVIFFTYFYTSTVAFKTDEVAENLQKSGAYIPGYRPGEDTEEYLSYISNRLNVAGSLFLAIIAIAPIILSQSNTAGLNSVVGGTTLLILVSVTIETLRQIEAQATAVDYDRFTKY